MSISITDQEPRQLWQEFAAISAIPRCSKCEADVLAYIQSEAESRKLEIRRDPIGNLLVVLPPTPGMEHIPGLVIQGHVDMVCEKNEGTAHDFSKDPIRLKIDGEWLKAEGTTLGADNGIAVAIMLTLIKGDMPHGPLELLFTIDEETGLTGAIDLDPSILTHRTMINLDSEEEGIFYIGCAGGKETIGHLDLQWEDAPSGLARGRIAIQGLNGGHSGSEIHRQLGNSLVLATRILHQLDASKIRLSNMYGGDKHNAIPREAFIEFLAPESEAPSLRTLVNEYLEYFRGELGNTEENLRVNLEFTAGVAGTEYPSRVLTSDSQRLLSNLLYSIPHGVQSMSRAIPGLVSTSTNFAAMKIRDGRLEVLTSQRSDIKSQADDIANRVAAPFLLAGGSVTFTREYPGWKPDTSSALLAHSVKVWEGIHGKKPQITSIHAGLECGVIGAKCGGMEMISFGPDIRGAHTPDERVHIQSTARIYEFFLKLLLSF